MPYLMRINSGLRRPKVTRLGVDMAGHVEAVGKSVTQFKPGDEVFGNARGAFAEFVCASEQALLMKPDASRSRRRRQYLWRQSPHCTVFATREGFSRGRRS
jgi:threonine dehydrogenase-like Zn-dependent dehydrogenase